MKSKGVFKRFFSLPSCASVLHRQPKVDYDIECDTGSPRLSLIWKLNFREKLKWNLSLLILDTTPLKPKFYLQYLMIKRDRVLVRKVKA